MKTNELLPFTPSAPPTTKVTIEAPFPPIKNKTLRKLRPILRILGICHHCKVTFTLREMTTGETYDYLIAMFNGFKKMADNITTAGTVLGAVETGYNTSIEIAKMNAANMAMASRTDDIEFFAALQASQSRILEKAVEEANPVLKEEKLRLEFVYLSTLGIIEEAPEKVVA